MTARLTLIRSSIIPLAVLNCHSVSLSYSPYNKQVNTVRRTLCAEHDVRNPQHEQLLKTYDNLKNQLKEIERLSGISALLGWDEAVMMPPLSSKARNSQSGALAGVIFEKRTAPELGAAVKELNTKVAKSFFSTSPYDMATIRDAARDYDLEIRKTKDMVTKMAELEGRGYTEWVTARKEDDWNSFKGVLKEIVAMKKHIASVTQPSLSNYDANINLYERGMTSGRIEEIFSFIKSRLNPLINKITHSSVKKAYNTPKALNGGEDWNIDQQRSLCLEIARDMGFDFDRGRLDVSVHPFTGGPHPTDVRITTRYSTNNWLEGIAGTVHEVGHALYEQGRNADWDDLPVSRALSMGVHESQSLFWERMIFQSRDFWVYATPLVHKYFPHTKDCSVDDFYKYVNRVEPGFIRVDADEVTYPIHIILRFEMEKDLFNEHKTSKGSSENMDDLPQKWNSVMKSSLGLTVPTNSKGILQDVHWPMGAFGYFPSYTLGAIIAVQLYDHAVRNIPDMQAKIRRGDFKEIREFLRSEIHEVGSLYESPDELLIKVTGEKMSPKHFIDYLENKYKSLYNLD